jgi:hypothetical protein
MLYHLSHACSKKAFFKKGNSQSTNIGAEAVIHCWLKSAVIQGPKGSEGFCELGQHSRKAQWYGKGTWKPLVGTFQTPSPISPTVNVKLQVLVKQYMNNYDDKPLARHTGVQLLQADAFPQWELVSISGASWQRISTSTCEAEKRPSLSVPGQGLLHAYQLQSACLGTHHGAPTESTHSVQVSFTPHTQNKVKSTRPEA